MSHGNGQATAAPPAPLVSTDDLINRMSTELKDLEVNKFFRALVKLQGSDLHMKVGKPPCVRVRNELKPLNRGPIDSEEMVRLLVPLLGERYRKIFADEGGADFAYFCEVDGENWRFRVNRL